MILDNLITIDLSKLDIRLSAKILNKVKKECKLKNPKFGMTKRMGYPTFGIPSFLYCYTYGSDDILTIYRGYLKKLEEFNLKIIDKTISSVIKKDLNINFISRPYQDKCVRYIVDNGCMQGYVLAPCGSGKTYIAMQLICELKQKTLIIVDTTLLMEQWKRDILENTDIKESDIGLYYGAKKKIGDVVTIALVQSFNKVATSMGDTFGMVIQDEMHKVPATTFVKSINNLKARYRFGLTATPRRRDGMHVIIPRIFGNVIYEITDKDIEDKKVNNMCLIRPTKFENLDNCEKMIKKNKKLSAIIRYAKEKDDKPLQDRMSAQLNRKMDHNIYLDEIQKDVDRNKLVLNDIKKEVDQGHKCVVFCERVAHCIRLDNTLKKNKYKSMLIIGGVGDEIKVNDIYQYADDLLTQNKIDIIIGTPKCINESMSISILDRAFVVSPNPNNLAKLKQQKGRIERFMIGKGIAITYYYWDKFIYEDNPKKKIKGLFTYVRTKF